MNEDVSEQEPAHNRFLFFDSPAGIMPKAFPGRDISCRICYGLDRFPAVFEEKMKNMFGRKRKNS